MDRRLHREALADGAYYRSEHEVHSGKAKKIGGICVIATSAYALDRLGVGPSGVGNEVLSAIEATVGTYAGILALRSFTLSWLAGRSARQVQEIVNEIESAG